MTKKEESEFGKGLTYCLGLFVAHERDRYVWCRKIEDISQNDAEMFFNAASDHFYELEVPDILPKVLKRRLSELKSKCLSWGHGYGVDKYPFGIASGENVFWALNEAKELLRLIDGFYGIKTIEASYK